MNLELNIQEKAEAINLAMQIELGNVSYSDIVNNIGENPRKWMPTLKFWMEFNDMTKKAVDLLTLESCYMLEAYNG